MAGIKLVFFNGGGRGECIRFLLHACDAEFEDSRVEMADWPALKPKTPFGGLPYIVKDGKDIGESMAIVRYLAKELGVAGKTSMDQALADSVACAATDIREAAIPHFLSTAEEGEKMFSWENMDAKAKKFCLETMPPMLDRLEAFLKKNNGGDGYFVGDSMTYADIQFFSVTDGKMIPNREKMLENHPKLAALCKKVGANKGIAAYMETRPDEMPF